MQLDAQWVALKIPCHLAESSAGDAWVAAASRQAPPTLHSATCTGSDAAAAAAAAAAVLQEASGYDSTQDTLLEYGMYNNIVKDCFAYSCTLQICTKAGAIACALAQYVAVVSM
jgi:hypothetical protein